MKKEVAIYKVSKYGTLLSLYLAQSIPMAFFTTVLPIIMRTESYSLTSIGLLQLVKLPWILKFLWAPFIDRATDDLNSYKKWIFSSELFYALVIFGTAFLDFQTDFNLIIVLLLIAFTASATQDIATDAFAIFILKKEERGFGNGIQSAGSFLGTVTGGGLLLIIYHYLGWMYLLFALSSFVLLALLPLKYYKTKVQTQKKAKAKINFRDIARFFKQKNIWKRIVFLFFIYSGIVGSLTMLKPWLVDLGYSVKEIGIYSGIYGALAGAVTAIITGIFIEFLGKKKTLRLLLMYVLLVSVLFWYLSQTNPTYVMLQVAVLGVWSTFGMATVFVYTSSMDLVRVGREGTDFTIQIVLTHLGSLLLAVLSGKIAQSLGYSGLFLMEILISILLLISLPVLYKEKRD